MQNWIETKSDHEIYFTTDSELAYDAVQTNTPPTQAHPANKPGGLRRRTGQGE